MPHDPSGICLKRKYVAMKDEDEEQRGDRGEEVSHWTDDGEHFVPALTRIPRDEEHNPSGIRLQYKHREKEDGGKRDTGGGRFLEPTLIRLPPAEGHKREDITLSNADDDNKKPAATADLSRVSDHDVSPRTVVRTLSEPVNRVQFPQADSPTCGHHSMYKMEMKASKNSHKTAPPSAFDAASWGDPWPSGGITMLSGAQWASPESARIKNESIGQAAAGNQPMVRPHFVSSPAMPPLPGSTQLTSPPVLSPSTNVAAAVPPPSTATGPKNNHEDFMHVKALIRAWDKMNVEMKPAPTDNRVPFGPEFKDQAHGFNPIERERIKMKAKIKSVPTDNRVPFGPKFKDQARGFKPIEEERVENVDSHQSSTGGLTFEHQMREEDSEEEIDTEAGDASISDSGHGAISNGTTRLVEAELVIPAEAEVIEVKPQRTAWLVVLALLLTGVILGGILGSRPDSRDTENASNVENAGCDNATALELDGAAIVIQLSSNEFFSVDDSLLQGCGAVPEPTDEHIGIWYIFETNMTRGVRVSTCTDSVNDDFDRNLLVFSGPCDQLNCLPGNNEDDGGPLQGCGREKAVSFQALPSPSAYHVLVYGRKASSSTEGNFTLQATNRHVRPTNDACEGALEIDGEWHNSSALDADDGSVWFLFKSREGEITISTCSPSNSFGCNIYVYSGSCSSLGPLFVPVVSTMIEESLHCSGTLNSVQFFSYIPATYRIEVMFVTDPTSAQTPTPNHDLANLTGYVPQDFAIVARSNSTMFESAGCEGAIALELGKTVAFTGVSVDTRASCNISNPASAIAAGGAWFQVIGNDTSYTATACGELSHNTLDSQINVYSGKDCQDLMCVAFIDSYSESGCNFGISWLAESAIQFWIQVLVFSDDGGAFPIAVYPTPPNQECKDAIMLEAGQETINGTTLGALAGPKDILCGTVLSVDYEGVPAVWYSVTGIDEDLTAFTCSEFDSKIFVYNGTCGNLTCIDGNDYYDPLTICSGEYVAAAAVGWFAKVGMVYHIKVTGFLSTGNFELGIQIGKKEILYPTDPTEPPPENDDCENAKWVSHENIPGSTYYATPSFFLSDELSVCNGKLPMSYHLSPDVWYQFNGTGEWHTATTCTGIVSLDYFDSYVVIYTGTCSNLTCIASNDDGFSSNCAWYNAIASWLTEEGETYLIRVSPPGWCEDCTGDFGIRIEDGKIELPPEPVNNHCENATLLEFDKVVKGTTLGATPSLEEPECAQDSSYARALYSPDVWYRLFGTGNALTVTTCTNTNLDECAFNTILAVYKGNCTSELTCIAEKEDEDYDSSSDIDLSWASWQSELNEEYHVRVLGPNEFSFGTFVIKAYRGTPDGKPPPDPFSTTPPY